MIDDKLKKQLEEWKKELDKIDSKYIREKNEEENDLKANYKALLIENSDLINTISNQSTITNILKIEFIRYQELFGSLPIDIKFNPSERQKINIEYWLIKMFDKHGFINREGEDDIEENRA